VHLLPPPPLPPRPPLAVRSNTTAVVRISLGITIVDAIIVRLGVILMAITIRTVMDLTIIVIPMEVPTIVPRGVRDTILPRLTKGESFISYVDSYTWTLIRS